ncbi:hypothetical protein MUG91_G15n162 [Manis pentadactyla]|nr:hypothetical protein MUG91_G15n162 [Manis pentadactyla]
MAGSDALDKPIDTNPPPLAIVFWSPQTPHEAMGSTTAGFLCGRRPDLHATAFGRGTYNCHLAPDKSVGCTGAILKADAQDQLKDTTSPSMAVIFRSPLAAHEAVGSSTFGPRAGNDAQGKPIDTAPPSMAVILHWQRLCKGP